MISYLIKSMSCAALLLAFYHLFLLPEKMNRFKRWYLLLSLIGSLIIPVLPTSLEILPPLVPVSLASTTQQTLNNITKIGSSAPLQSSSWLENVNGNETDASHLIILCYCLISLALIIQTLCQLLRFRRITRTHQIEQTDGIRLILLRDGPLSFSFLHYICIAPTDINKNTGRPIKAIYLHELSHVRQNHSIDILITSFIRALFWWNPFVYLYKKAIQLNHEFLADEVVLTANNQPANYQRLLLSRVQGKPKMTLSSTSLFSLTKKRFKMMTKHSSKIKISILQAAGTCLASICLLLLSQQTTAQDTVKEGKINSPQQIATKQKGISQSAFDTYQKIMAKHLTTKGKTRTWRFNDSEEYLLQDVTKTYKAMSTEQQKHATVPPPLPPPPPPPSRTKKIKKVAPPPPPPPHKASKTKKVAPPPPPPPARK